MQPHPTLGYHFACHWPEIRNKLERALFKCTSHVYHAGITHSQVLASCTCGR